MGITINKSQQQNHILRTESSLSHRVGGGGLNAFYLYQIFALDSDVVELQELFSPQGSILTTIVPTKSDSHVIFCLQLLSI